MALDYQSLSAATPAREVGVTVFDSEGRLIGGTSISFVVNGTAVGDVPASEGKATIALFDPLVSLEVIAAVDGQVQRTLVNPSDTTVHFKFAGLRGGGAVPTPEAKCWNGTTGRPCVVCPIGGSFVRICC